MVSNGRRQSTPPATKDSGYNPPSHRFLLRPSWHAEDVLVGLQISIVHFLIVFFSYSHVPEPYMDEIFHVNQVRRYCRGDFSWDPKITTPPALYLLALPFCRYQLERYVNSALMFLFFIGCCRFRRLFTRSTIKLTSFTVCFLPVLFHTSALFYTDLLSVCAVVWGFTLPTWNASVCFFIAICSRQTNIIWAGLYAMVRMYHHFDGTRPIKSLINSALRLWPFILLAAFFSIFLLINGGVVLGDPAAHQSKPHFAQLLYFVAFCAAHAGVQVLPLLPELIQACFSYFYLGICALFFIFARFFAYDHPYLLSDNRHIAFYLWKNFLKYPAIQTALVPLYSACLLFVLKMSSSIPPFVQFLFASATAVVLVPAHLFEPRYFIIPYVLWRLSASPSSVKCIAILDILLNCIVFLLVYLAFIFYTFEWGNEPGVKQRFMW